MKVRFGFTCPGEPELALDDFPGVVADLERLGFDSVWLPEVMQGGAFDPVVALTHAAAITRKLKIGAYVIVPGRNPVRLARELANLDRLCDGRLLLLMVLGLPSETELLAQGVEKKDRPRLMEEVVPLLRRLWSGEAVDHEGPRHPQRGARIAPLPKQQPLEMWFGGEAPAALRRAGRLADGWLPGLFITPAEAAEKRRVIEASAAEAGRAIDPEHFGVNLTYRRGPLPEGAAKALRARKPDLDPEAFLPELGPALHERVDEWLAAGFSKFLLRPVVTPKDWSEELETLAAEILPRQS